MNSTNGTTVVNELSHSSCILQVLVVISFLIGIIGNATALVILYKSARTRNRKHVLMLRWLAINDLSAAIGMLTVTNMMRYNLAPVYWTCTILVILRGFGLGSGGVAFIMAFERWLALTRPFLYHKLVTFDVLKRTLCCVWLGVLTLTYLPLFGFGLYFDYKEDKCIRYRNAKEFTDKFYAWFFFAVGIMLCLSITLCNIAVVCELSTIRSQNRVLVRRISRSLIVNNRARSPRHHQTPEEVAFAKLMAYISIIFVVCWGPQLITIPLAQFGFVSKASVIFMRIADMLMAAYFMLDPFVYVLQRYIEKGPFGLTWCFLNRRTSTSSLPTTTTTGGVGKAKHCSLQSNCSLIKNTTCLKNLCLCGDNHAPNNGECNAQWQGPNHICTKNEECVEFADCIPIKDIKKLSKEISHLSSSSEISICRCQDGYIELGATCGGETNFSTIPVMILAVVLFKIFN